jgi:hypothetical protein
VGSAGGISPCSCPAAATPPLAAPRSVPAGSVVGIDSTLNDDDNIGARRLLRAGAYVQYAVLDFICFRRGAYVQGVIRVLDIEPLTCGLGVHMKTRSDIT